MGVVFDVVRLQPDLPSLARGAEVGGRGKWCVAWLFDWMSCKCGKPLKQPHPEQREQRMMGGETAEKGQKKETARSDKCLGQ